MKKISLLVAAVMQLLLLSAQQKTIVERLGYPRNTKLLIQTTDEKKAYDYIKKKFLKKKQ